MGFVVLALAGVGIFFALNAGPEYELTAPAVAAGLRKAETVAGESPVFGTISRAVAQGDADQNSSVTAVYQDGLNGGTILFFGGTGKVGDPEDFLRRARPFNLWTSSPISSADSETKEVCGVYRLTGQRMMYCAWATRGSFGFVAPSTPVTSTDYAALKSLMSRMRSDIQTKVG